MSSGQPVESGLTKKMWRGYGIIWYDVGIVLYCIVCCGMVWYSAASCGMPYEGMAQRGVVWCGVDVAGCSGVGIG